MDELVNYLVDEVIDRDWSLIPIENAIFLSPVGGEISKHGRKDTYWLQRDIKANKHEQVDNVDVLISNLKLKSFMQLIVLLSTLVKFAI